ncbi:Maspardin-like protein [Drosera capensis]
MKGGVGFAAPGDYVYFKSQVPLHKIPIGSKQWRYYDFGPKLVSPLICIPGTAGSADVYYKQIMALSIKGYRVISIDVPRVWNHHEWIQAFEKFLDAIDLHHIHIYGTSLGGFLAQIFAEHRPRRVRSLILSNTYLETRTFSSAMPWAPVVGWTPAFLLKRYVLTGIRAGPHEPFIADSVDFVVSQVETLSRDDLASRLTLTVDSAVVGPLRLSDALITIMDTNDYCAIPQQLKDEVGERYPGARRADLKSGGDFPFLSRPDEVNLHLQIHLRRVGVEARPDLVPGVSKNVGSETHSIEDGREVDAYLSRDEEGSSSIEIKDVDDDPSKDDDDDAESEGNLGDPSKNDKKEDEYDPPKDEKDDDDDDLDNDPDDDEELGDPEGPSKTDDREDSDDSPNESGGSNEGPSTNNEEESGENPGKKEEAGSSSHSNTEDRQEVDRHSEEKEPTTEASAGTTNSKSCSISCQQNAMLLLDQALKQSQMFRELTRVRLVSCFLLRVFMLWISDGSVCT